MQDALAAFLRDAGWRVVRTANTAAKEQGADIFALKDDRTLVVEVKGYPASGNKTPPANQARQWFSHAREENRLNRRGIVILFAARPA